MVVMNIILIFIGVLFVGFGYFIFFKGKYGLINDFKKEKKSGKLDNSYAKRVGLIELIGGITSMFAGSIAIISNSFIFSISALLICITCIIVALLVNRKKSLRRL